MYINLASQDCSLGWESKKLLAASPPSNITKIHLVTSGIFGLL